MDRVSLRKRVQELLEVIQIRSHKKNYGDAVVELKSLGQEAVYVLSDQLWHENSDWRNEAAHALGLLGPDGAAAIPSLVRMLGDGQSSTGKAEWALAQMGASAIPELLQATRSDNRRMRDRALCALELGHQQSDDVIDALARALQDEVDSVRNNAARVLGMMGPRSARAVPALLEACCTDADSWNRSVMRLALIEIGPSALPALMKALENDSPVIRRAAADILSTVRRCERNVVAKTVACIKVEGDEKVRTELATALEELAMYALGALKEAVAGLRTIAQTDPNGAIRTMSVLAYEQIIEDMAENFPTGTLELAELHSPANQRPRKRISAERDKCLLALVDTCIEWTEPAVSERRIHRSGLLCSKRQALGLDEDISLSSVHKHLVDLAVACGIARILHPVEKRQTSRFAEGAIDKLRRIRSGLVGRIQREEERLSRQQEQLADDTKNLTSGG